MSRNCRICKVVLPASRYFNCLKCVPSMASEVDTIYESEELDEHLITMAEDLDLYGGLDEDIESETIA